MTPPDPLAPLRWHRSSYSTGPSSGGGDCVETAALPDGRFAVRDSANPAAGAVVLSRAQLGRWIAGVRDDRFGRPTG